MQENITSRTCEGRNLRQWNLKGRKGNVGNAVGSVLEISALPFLCKTYLEKCSWNWVLHRACSAVVGRDVLFLPGQKICSHYTLCLSNGDLSKLCFVSVFLIIFYFFLSFIQVFFFLKKRSLFHSFLFCWKMKMTSELGIRIVPYFDYWGKGSLLQPLD